jgi:hypothetical protein
VEEHEETRFLPPEPTGPEPELGDRPQPQAPAQPQQAPGQAPQQPQQPTYGYPPPPPGQPYYPPPPPGYGYPPPGQGYPPPGQPYPAWGYQQAQAPDNGQAVAGFVLSLVSLGLLVISFGLSSIVSVGCAIAGIICGRNGKRKVDRGETPKHRGLAQAGFIIGWVSLVLSVLATIGWIVFVIVAANDDGYFDDNDNSITAAASAIRLAAAVVGS